MMGRYKVGLGTIAVALCLIGCAATHDSRGRTLSTETDPMLAAAIPPEPTESSYIGACLVGAFAGLLTAMTASGNDNRLAMGLGGAAAGCGIGVAANYGLDAYRQRFATAEDQLNAATVDVEREIASTQKVMAAVQGMQTRDQTEIARLQSELAQGRGNRDALERKLAQVRKNVQDLRAYADRQRQARTDLSRASDEIKSAAGTQPRTAAVESNAEALARYERRETELRELIESYAERFDDTKAIAPAS